MEPIFYLGPLFVFFGVILVFWSITRSTELDPVQARLQQIRSAPASGQTVGQMS